METQEQLGPPEPHSPSVGVAPGAAARAADGAERPRTRREVHEKLDRLYGTSAGACMDGMCAFLTADCREERAHAVAWLAVRLSVPDFMRPLEQSGIVARLFESTLCAAEKTVEEDTAPGAAAAPIAEALQVLCGISSVMASGGTFTASAGEFRRVSGLAARLLAPGRAIRVRDLQSCLRLLEELLRSSCAGPAEVEAAVSSPLSPLLVACIDAQRIEDPEFVLALRVLTVLAAVGGERAAKALAEARPYPDSPSLLQRADAAIGGLVPSKLDDHYANVAVCCVALLARLSESPAVAWHMELLQSPNRLEAAMELYPRVTELAKKGNETESSAAEDLAEHALQWAANLAQHGAELEASLRASVGAFAARFLCQDLVLATATKPRLRLLAAALRAVCVLQRPALCSADFIGVAARGLGGILRSTTVKCSDAEQAALALAWLARIVHASDNVGAFACKELAIALVAALRGGAGAGYLAVVGAVEWIAKCGDTEKARWLSWRIEGGDSCASLLQAAVSHKGEFELEVVDLTFEASAAAAAASGVALSGLAPHMAAVASGGRTEAAVTTSSGFDQSRPAVTEVQPRSAAVAAAERLLVALSGLAPHPAAVAAAGAGQPEPAARDRDRDPHASDGSGEGVDEGVEAGHEELEVESGTAANASSGSGPSCVAEASSSCAGPSGSRASRPQFEYEPPSSDLPIVSQLSAAAAAARMRAAGSPSAVAQQGTSGTVAQSAPGASAPSVAAAQPAPPPPAAPPHPPSSPHPPSPPQTQSPTPPQPQLSVAARPQPPHLPHPALSQRQPPAPPQHLQPQPPLQLPTLQSPAPSPPPAPPLPPAASQAPNPPQMAADPPSQPASAAPQQPALNILQPPSTPPPSAPAESTESGLPVFSSLAAAASAARVHAADSCSAVVQQSGGGPSATSMLASPAAAERPPATAVRVSPVPLSDVPSAFPHPLPGEGDPSRSPPKDGPSSATRQTRPWYEVSPPTKEELRDIRKKAVALERRANELLTKGLEPESFCAQFEARLLLLEAAYAKECEAKRRSSTSASEDAALAADKYDAVAWHFARSAFAASEGKHAICRLLCVLSLKALAVARARAAFGLVQLRENESEAQGTAERQRAAGAWERASLLLQAASLDSPEPALYARVGSLLSCSWATAHPRDALDELHGVLSRMREAAASAVPACADAAASSGEAAAAVPPRFQEAVAAAGSGSSQSDAMVGGGGKLEAPAGASPLPAPPDRPASGNTAEDDEGEEWTARRQKALDAQQAAGSACRAGSTADAVRRCIDAGLRFFELGVLGESARCKREPKVVRQCYSDSSQAFLEATQASKSMRPPAIHAAAFCAKAQVAALMRVAFHWHQTIALNKKERKGAKRARAEAGAALLSMKRALAPLTDQRPAHASKQPARAERSPAQQLDEFLPSVEFFDPAQALKQMRETLPGLMGVERPPAPRPAPPATGQSPQPVSPAPSAAAVWQWTRAASPSAAGPSSPHFPGPLAAERSPVPRSAAPRPALVSSAERSPVPPSAAPVAPQLAPAAAAERSPVPRSAAPIAPQPAPAAAAVRSPVPRSAAPQPAPAAAGGLFSNPSTSPPPKPALPAPSAADVWQRTRAASPPQPQPPSAPPPPPPPLGSANGASHPASAAAAPQRLPADIPTVSGAPLSSSSAAPQGVPRPAAAAAAPQPQAPVSGVAVVDQWLARSHGAAFEADRRAEVAYLAGNKLDAVMNYVDSGIRFFELGALAEQQGRMKALELGYGNAAATFYKAAHLAMLLEPPASRLAAFCLKAGGVARIRAAFHAHLAAQRATSGLASHAHSEAVERAREDLRALKSLEALGDPRLDGFLGLHDLQQPAHALKQMRETLAAVLEAEAEHAARRREAPPSESAAAAAIATVRRLVQAAEAAHFSPPAAGGGSSSSSAPRPGPTSALPHKRAAPDEPDRGLEPPRQVPRTSSQPPPAPRPAAALPPAPGEVAAIGTLKRAWKPEHVLRFVATSEPGLPEADGAALLAAQLSGARLVTLAHKATQEGRPLSAALAERAPGLGRAGARQLCRLVGAFFVGGGEAWPGLGRFLDLNWAPGEVPALD